MKAIEIIFWVSTGLIFYTYLGYGIILYGIVRIKRSFHRKNKALPVDYEPDVTLLIAAYNEKDFVQQKVQNTLTLDYPSDKLHQIWVTDGSNDGTQNFVRKYPDIKVLHESSRNGKIAAINRGMKYVKTPIVIFSDANTLLGEKSIRIIVALFSDPVTGCVSGEKRIFNREKDAAAGSGEGLYWKYESALKSWDSELNSAVGAAGELFAIRTKLFQEVEPDTLLDDFIISLRIAMKGYKIQYDPEAYAMETASANVKEELKRKIRISAGGIQSVIRLRALLNPFKYGLLSFQYVSHRVLRWTIAPFSLLLIFIINSILAYNNGSGNSFSLYILLFMGQILFYLAAFAGWIFESKKIRIKGLFIPYYFFMMNLSVFMGFNRLLAGKQSVVWAKAKRG